MTSAKSQLTPDPEPHTEQGDQARFPRLNYGWELAREYPRHGLATEKEEGLWLGRNTGWAAGE